MHFAEARPALALADRPARGPRGRLRTGASGRRRGAGDRGRRHRRRASSPADRGRRLEHGRPAHDRGRRGFQRREPRRPGHRRHLRHRRRLRAVLRRRDRHLRRLAPDQGRGGGDLRGERHRVRRVPGRERRAHRRRQPGERLGDVPHGRPAEDDLGARTRRSTNWNEVDPSFPDEQLTLFGPGTDSGTFDYFTDAINGEEGASRTDYTATEDDNVTVQGVAGDKGGLGYFGFSYYEQNQDKLKAVEIDGGDGCVAPSAETAQDGTYTPLSRPLFIYAKKESLERPEVAGVRRVLPRQRRRRSPRPRSVRPARPTSSAQKAQADVRGGARWRLRRLRWPHATSPPQARSRLPGCAPGGGGAARTSSRASSSVCAADLGRDDGRDRHLAARARDRVLPRGQLRRLPHRDDAGRRSSSRRDFGVLPLARRHALDHVLGRARRDPVRARRRDLPERVRAARACAGVLKPVLEILAGIPTVVFGYFALTFVTPLLRDIGIDVEIFNALSRRPRRSASC